MNKTIEEATSSQCPVQDRKSLIIWGLQLWENQSATEA